MDLVHYEGRLRMIPGDEGYRTALEMLTEAAVNGGRLCGDAIGRYREFLAAEAGTEAGTDPAPDRGRAPRAGA